MKKFVFKSFAQFNDNLKNIAFEGIGFTIILSILLLLLVINIFQAFKEADYNNKIFDAESELLVEARNKNQELKDFLDYLQTDEYLRLRAREVYGLGSGNEQLYKPAESVSFVNVRKELLDLGEKDNFVDWWGYLF